MRWYSLYRNYVDSRFWCQNYPLILLLAQDKEQNSFYWIKVREGRIFILPTVSLNILLCVQMIVRRAPPPPAVSPATLPLITTHNRDLQLRVSCWNLPWHQPHLSSLALPAHYPPYSTTSGNYTPATTCTSCNLASITKKFNPTDKSCYESCPDGT